MYSVFKKTDRQKWIIRREDIFLPVQDEEIKILLNNPKMKFGNYAVYSFKYKYFNLEYKDALTIGKMLSLLENDVFLFRQVLQDNLNEIYLYIGEFKNIAEKDLENMTWDDLLFLDNIFEDIEKTSDPLTPEGMIVFVQRILKDWAEILPDIDTEYNNYMANFLNSYNWGQMTETEIEGLFIGLAEWIPKDTIQKALPELLQVTDSYILKIGEEVRKHLVNVENINIATSLAVKDVEAMKFISKSGINYFPTSFTKQSTGLATMLKHDLIDALDQGIHYTEAVKKIEKELPFKISKKRNNWWNIASQSLVHRGRERARLEGYYDAGIEQVRVWAVLDERTTPICQFLHGKVVQVKPVRDKWLDLEKEDVPVDNQFSWLTIKGGSIYSQSVEIANNDTGVFEWVKGMDMDKALDYGVGLPPYHALCRSTAIYETI